MKTQVHTQKLSSEFLFFLVAILIAFSFTACDECILGEKNQHIDMGDIPLAIRDCVPYQDGDTVKFVDPEGNAHLFKVIRVLEYHETAIDYDCHINYIKYQTDSLLLYSDTYNRVITFGTSNYHPSGLNIIHSYSIHFGIRYFIVPISDKAINSVDQLDSLIVDGEIFTEVFVITPTVFGYSWMDSIKTDTIFYNYEYGMLKVTFDDSTFFIRND